MLGCALVQQSFGKIFALSRDSCVFRSEILDFNRQRSCFPGEFKAGFKGIVIDDVMIVFEGDNVVCRTCSRPEQLDPL